MNAINIVHFHNGFETRFMYGFSEKRGDQLTTRLTRKGFATRLRVMIFIAGGERRS